MESYDSRVIIKDSDIKNPLDGKKSFGNEKDSSILPVTRSNSVSYSSLECNEDIFCNKRDYSHKKPFMMPNELYIGLNSDTSQSSNMCSKTERLDFFAISCHSTPASPEETERTRGKQMKKELSSFHSPRIEKKLPFSYSTSFVRTSRSEDHLQKSSLTTVNIDIEDELASSLDTLLDTKADEVYNEIGDEECLSSSSSGVAYTGNKSPDHSSSKSDMSHVSSSDTTSRSKVSIKITDAQNARRAHSDPVSESSESEIIPSDSSTTIRKDSEGSNDCECTSEQISAISSLDDATDLSRATDSDLGSPDGSLSPGSEINLEDDWVKDIDKKESVSDVFQDITNKNKMINKTIRQVPQHLELNLTNTCVPEPYKPVSLQVGTAEKSPTSRSSSLSVPKVSEEKVDVSAESPTSQCSEDTFADVSYHELTESYDEASAATEFDEQAAEPVQSTQRSESPPTDDESDIESLHSFHYSPKAVDIPSAVRLSKRLYGLEGFKKTDVSRHLSKNNEFSRAVAEEYLKFFDFTNNSLDVALRKFLNQFCLIGETQERERVLVHFSKRYLDCNPNSFKSQDAVHTLTCALMLLNTDLHGENLRRKMVCGEFIENLAELNDGENFPRDVLKALYYSIKTQPLEWSADKAEKKSSSKYKSSSNDYRQSFIGHNALEVRLKIRSSILKIPRIKKRSILNVCIPTSAVNIKCGEKEEKKSSSKNKSSSIDYRQSFIGHNPFLEVPNPNCATEYKKGYVMRKCCMDPTGKKTPLGRRSWKMLYATLRDLVLYLHKDEHGFKKNQLYDSLHNSIRIHHAFAEKATDYTKKQYVFRLHTADHAVYLFQTSDSKELESWVDTINLVAASLSSPPLPSGVGCQKKFQRPLLPVSHTKLNLREQLQDHETRIVWLEKEYEELLSKTPEKSSKSRFAQECVEKEAHLLNELTRYRTYAFLLRTRMAQYPELETPLVQTSIGELEEPVEKSNSPKKTNSPSSSPVKKVQIATAAAVEGRCISPNKLA